MRIWLNPAKLKQYNLMPSDVRAAIEAQNTQVAAGAIGDLPAIDEQYLNAKVTSGSRLKPWKNSRILLSNRIVPAALFI